MFSSILIAGLFFCGTQATFDDMTDEDFSIYLDEANKVMEKYGETAAKGCITGGIGGATGGIPGLCIGCGLGALGNIAQDAIYQETNKDFERVRAYENRNNR